MGVIVFGTMVYIHIKIDAWHLASSQFTVNVKVPENNNCLVIYTFTLTLDSFQLIEGSININSTLTFLMYTVHLVHILLMFCSYSLAPTVFTSLIYCKVDSSFHMLFCFHSGQYVVCSAVLLSVLHCC
jgi:hypothetical protein